MEKGSYAMKHSPLSDKTKWIFITGGLSGLGKGVLASSIALVLQSRGFHVENIKIDPYLNYDAGTMSPFEHGEVFVVDDGKECDLDLGNYERFLGKSLKGTNNITTGTVYTAVLQKERKGDYLGATVQIVPHLTNEIKHQLKMAANGCDIAVVEVGGTVGHLESAPFLEAARQMMREHEVMFCHVAHVPTITDGGEQKTMPSQESTMLLRQAGIQPDVILARSKDLLEGAAREKIRDRCNVDCVVSARNVSTIYEIPLVLREEKLEAFILEKLKLSPSLCATCGGDMLNWKELVDRIKDPVRSVNIAICGKYTALKDSYVSLEEALIHAGAAYNARVNIEYIEVTDLTDMETTAARLKAIHGCVVPIGWGSRGSEGKMNVARYCRENKVPFFGICYGFQMAVVEYARNVCNLKGANSTEVDPDTPHPVVSILPDQLKKEGLGGTARLGLHTIELKEQSKVSGIYGGKSECQERFRHRFEVNPDYIKTLTDNGLVFSGKCPNQPIMQYLELPGHPFFVGTQSHPEYRSRLQEPSPPFLGLIKAALPAEDNATPAKVGSTSRLGHKHEC